MTVNTSRAIGAADGGGQGSAGQTYEVKSGDNLSKISKQFYGDPNEYMRIFYANRDKLNDPDKIQVGQQLVIRSEEHTSELQSPCNLVCRLLLEKKKKGQSVAKWIKT